MTAALRDALHGDNVVTASSQAPWHAGPTLLGHLRSVRVASDRNLDDFRSPVQWLMRSNNPTDPTRHGFRGFNGQVAGGIVRTGQRIFALPAGMISPVKQMWTYNGHSSNRLTGCFLLIEQGATATVAAGMLHTPREVVRVESFDYTI